MWDISPTLVRYDTIEPTSIDIQKLGHSHLAKTLSSKASNTPMKKPIKDFYQTNAIARASVTMAACSKAFVEKDYKLATVDSDNQVSTSHRSISAR